MLKKIIALTIPKCENRRWCFYGYHIARGVPKDMITYWIGETPLSYDNNFNRIADAAAADGFDFVRYFQGYENLTVLRQTPPQMCQVWSYAQILRHIADSNETSLVIWDDRYLSVPFGLLDILVEQLKDCELPFYLFQLRLRGDIDELRDPHPSLPSHTQKELFQAYVGNTDTSIYYKDAFTKLGMMGFDESIIFSPEGAAWMLEQMHLIEDVSPEMKVHTFFDLSFEHLPFYMKCVNIDSYICWGLRPAADAAIADGKGLYCPLMPGINFIDEPIAHGSDTNYLTEYIHESYHTYNKETQLRYLNQ